MQKGNVIVIGNSGVGKSTLINAVLGKEMAKVDYGEEGITPEVGIYEGELFNIIDTMGFEPSILKSNKAINAIKRWSAKSAKEENEDKQINVIWFCVEGTSRKLFPKAIKDLNKAVSMWKSVPIIAVITKSYSVPERGENIELVKTVFEKNKALNERLKGIIPVVASTYVLNENSAAPPEGIAELIEKTNELMPEGFKAAKKDITKFNLGSKRATAQSAVVVSAGTAVGKCFINIGASDSIVLSAIENTLVTTLAKIYNIDNKSETVLFIKNNIDNGNVNKIAKKAIETIEKIPKFNKLGATIINPVIAAGVVMIIGEYTAASFEKIYLGEDESKGKDKFKEIFESEFIVDFVEHTKTTLTTLTEKSNPKEITQAVTRLFKKNKEKTKK